MHIGHTQLYITMYNSLSLIYNDNDNKESLRILEGKTVVTYPCSNNTRKISPNGCVVIFFYL